MNNFVYKKDAEKALDKAGMKYEEIGLDNGWSVIITEYGGRILGPFKSDEAESIFWMNSFFKDADAFKKEIEMRNWNIGGDRFWVEPELPYFIPDSSDFFGSYVVPGEIDPGNYEIIRCGDKVSLSQNVDTEVYESEIERKRFKMARTIYSLENPFTDIAKKHGVTECFGIGQDVEITDMSSDDKEYLESWILTQVNPSGELIVPYMGNEADYLDYYEPIEEEKIKDKDGKLYIDVTGDVRYKLGFEKKSTTGRTAYLGTLKDGRSYLFVKSFFNNPSAIYSGGPSWDKTRYGYSTFLFNDSGALGGFAEYETCGTTIAGDTGKKYVNDLLYYYFFVGDKENLMKIADEIL